MKIPLDEDPNELRNLAHDKKDVLKQLEGHLHEVCDPQQEQQRAEQYIRKQLEAIERLG